MMDRESAAENDADGESATHRTNDAEEREAVSSDSEATHRQSRNKKSGKSKRGGKTKKSGKGGTPATLVLEQQGYAYAIHTFQHDPAVSNFGMEAADRLDVDPRRIFKTLIVDTGSGLVAALVPVSRSLDLRALASALGEKRAEMADVATAERVTGYRLGAISPLGMKQSISVVIDVSSADDRFFYISGGRRGFELEIRVQAVVDLTNARLAPIAR